MGYECSTLYKHIPLILIQLLKGILETYQEWSNLDAHSNNGHLQISMKRNLFYGSKQLPLWLTNYCCNAYIMLFFKIFTSFRF